MGRRANYALPPRNRRPRTVPACWTWPAPTADGHARLYRQTAADWLEDGSSLTPDRDTVRWYLMRKWMAGRCATYGERSPGSLVEDHCHVTGLFRGYLCRSCNTLEGYSGDYPDSLFGMYRERNPATIFNIKQPYSSTWK